MSPVRFQNPSSHKALSGAFELSQVWTKIYLPSLSVSKLLISQTRESKRKGGGGQIAKLFTGEQERGAGAKALDPSPGHDPSQSLSARKAVSCIHSLRA